MKGCHLRFPEVKFRYRVIRREYGTVCLYVNPAERLTLGVSGSKIYT